MFGSGDCHEEVWKLSRSRQTADRAGESIASQQRLAQEATALVTALRGATTVGTATESSTTKRGRQAADDSPPTRGRQRRSTPQSRENYER